MSLSTALAGVYPISSFLHVPRKTPHAFSNESETPAVAYVIYAPPLDPLDRHMIDRD